jgi:circadian clock protein KaiB
VTLLPRNATADFELALTRRDSPRLVLRLFIAGATPRSQRAVKNLRTLCDQHFPGGCEIEVIDVYQQPSMAREHQVLVVPTLIRDAPAPTRRIVGDLSNTEVVLAALRHALPEPRAHATKNEPTKKKNQRGR